MNRYLIDLDSCRTLSEVEVLNYTQNPLESVLTASGVAYNKDLTSSLNTLMGKTFHESPFRHAHFTFRLKVPLYIFRQLQRAEVGRDFVERSLRYTKVDSTDDFFWTQDYEKDYIKKAIDLYKSAISLHTADSSHGLTAEEARRLLPQSMFVTTVMTVSLSWLLRLLEHRVFNKAAQYRTRVVAAHIIYSVDLAVTEDRISDQLFSTYASKYLNIDFRTEMLKLLYGECDE